MNRKILIILNFLLLAIIFVFGYYFVTERQRIFAQSNFGIYPSVNLLDSSVAGTEGSVLEIKREKPAEKEIRGLYLTSYSAASSRKIDEIIEFMKGTDLNAVVIDIKDYSGQLSYDSNVKLVEELGTDRTTIKDLPAVVKKLHDNDIYAIARQTVFQDPELSEKKPEWAVKNSATGGVWRDNKGLGWMDASRQEVWEYNVAIAKEAISLGFDEINFDYIRFPSDGKMSLMQFAEMNGRSKAEVMAEFFKYLYENLKDEPAYISGDLFGFTTERSDDMNIGQQIEDAALYFDYVCPMVYPSHYPSGYLNLKNPAANPYEVITQAMKKGTESIQPVTKEIIEKSMDENGQAIEIKKEITTTYRAKIRPWLQAFNMGAVYTPAMIDAQIKASNEQGGYGYLLWNARNVYNYAPSVQ
ncbi:MAG: putative glycoside hydrolase [Candidatus Parcubacteria bacterium]|nr:putative glycoside hydrolase [Candidatus Parcubacteria bacterium]